MARSKQAVEVNKFNAGLITDASPLTTPDNSSLDEDNMVLNIDGSRNRRLGLDFEEGFSIINTNISGGSSSTAVSTFRWDNAGGDPEHSILVVQAGNQVKFFNMNQSSLSDGFFRTITYPNVSPTVRFSYSVVDGILVIVNGDKDIYLYEFISPDGIVQTKRRILIRDFFGVEDKVNNKDITRGNDVQTRTRNLTDNHLYNLRNQSFGIPRLRGDGISYGDPINYFYNVSNRYPSNSDTVTEALYNNPENTNDRTVERFFAEDLWRNPLGSTRAPLGFFIIDAIDRGTSRMAEYAANMVRYPQLQFDNPVLKADRSTAGPSSIAEFAGRIFYGGFPGSVEDGDTHSPKLSSYVFFSKVVENIADINLCYQEGDPTSKDSPDIVATDGGFIRINEAYNIQQLINLGSSLMVVAANGVWRIVGGSDTGFTATSYIVEKITDRGCTSAESIAQIDNSFMFWSDDAIWHVTTDQFGSWVCNNISFGRIQKMYDNISVSSKRRASGAYDSYERKVRWLYENELNSTVETRELVLDLQLQAYYTNSIKRIPNQSIKPVAIYTGLPYTISLNNIDVVVGSENIAVGTEQVVIADEEQLGINQRELGYLVITQTSPVIQYTFAKYRNTQFRDWYSFNQQGVDAAAYLITSYISGTDFQRSKQVSYITIHLRRTENGYDENMSPVNQSSCLTQARWGWSDSDNSGKWGREFQAYRYRRQYVPTGPDDPFDNGFTMISSRNRLRGTGKVLSLRFRTEPNKDLHLYGWSMIFEIEGNV